MKKSILGQKYDISIKQDLGLFVFGPFPTFLTIFDLSTLHERLKTTIKI